MIPNSCIRIDHKESFSTYCLCAAFHLLCLSILILFPILKDPNLFSCFSFGNGFIPLMTFAAFPWTFFISTFFFSKQEDQTVPSFQDAGKP